MVGMNRPDVVFTSGATEANNLAVRGLYPGSGDGVSMHMLAGATEHKSVLEAGRSIEEEYMSGSLCSIVPVLGDGTLDLGALESEMSRWHGEIDVVSVMAANSETGVIHP